VGTKKDALPPLVRAMATFVMTRPTGTLAPGVVELFQARCGVAERLQQRKMQRLWLYLSTLRTQDKYVDAQWLLTNSVAKISNDDALPAADKACALVFHAAVKVFSASRFVSLRMKKNGPEIKQTLVWKRNEVEENAKWLRHAAEVCSSVEQCWRQAGNTRHADAFALVAEYFKEQWDLNVAPNPFIVEEHGYRDEDRTRVVALTAEIQRLYGTPLYERTAQIASAALDVSNIESGQVRKWWQSFFKPVPPPP
jgi:hypothetical protein